MPVPVDRCVKCGTVPPEGLKKCSKCHGDTGVYCSKECQVAHWKVHKPICRPLQPTEVWGIKIMDNSYAPWQNQFKHILLNISHPIFYRGELCPLTKQCGFPLVIFSQFHNGLVLADHDNQPAVYLRIELDGVAPLPWLHNDAGTCYVVRADLKPLTKEAIEIVYKYHAHLLRIRPPGGWPRRPDPASLREFAEEYRLDQVRQGRQGFDFFPMFP